MVNVHVERETSAPPEAVLDTFRELDPERRAEIWSNVSAKHFIVHDSGPDFFEVTERTILAGIFWERSRYDWSTPGSVKATVLESNAFGDGSTFELRASPREGGGSVAALVVNRTFRPGPRGRLAATINHLSGKPGFGVYLRGGLKALEKRLAKQR